MNKSNHLIKPEEQHRKVVRSTKAEKSLVFDALLIARQEVKSWLKKADNQCSFPGPHRSIAFPIVA